MDGWIEIRDCPYCKDTLRPYKVVNTAPTFGIDFCKGYFPVITPVMFCKCDICGLVVQSPRMTDERIDFFYSSGLYRQTLGLSVEYMDEDEKRRAGDVANWLGFVETASHLDIGASRGYLLDEINAKLQHGFDNNPNYSETRQIYNRREDLKTYELVTSVHCLEHVTDPIEELKWYRSLTTKYLYVEVPGENCKGGPLRFAHLFYFPPDLLVKILEGLGLEVVEMETEPHTRILTQIL